MSWPERVSSRQLADHGIFRVIEHRMRPPAGRDYAAVCLEMPDWVTVVAVTRDGRVVLVRQKRYGVQRATLETPGGIVDPGESPRNAAARELYEETGHRARQVRSLGWVNPNPAIQNNRLHMFIAKDAERVVGSEVPPEPEAGEILRVVLVDQEQLIAKLRRGAVHHALSALALWRALSAIQGSPH